MSNAKSSTEPVLTPLEVLANEYELTRTEHSINGGEHHRFISTDRHESVPVPNNLPSILGKNSEGDPVTFFLVPTGADLSIRHETKVQHDFGKNLFRSIKMELLQPGDVFIPEAEKWPDDGEIIEALTTYFREINSVISDANERRDAIELLERERRPSTTLNPSLYASLARIDETTPMLIEGLMRERGVSVIFGDFDEFKTERPNNTPSIKNIKCCGSKSCNRTENNRSIGLPLTGKFGGWSN